MGVEGGVRWGVGAKCGYRGPDGAGREQMWDGEG